MLFVELVDLFNKGLPCCLQHDLLRALWIEALNALILFGGILVFQLLFFCFVPFDSPLHAGFWWDFCLELDGMGEEVSFACWKGLQISVLDEILFQFECFIVLDIDSIKLFFWDGFSQNLFFKLLLWQADFLLSLAQSFWITLSFDICVFPGASGLILLWSGSGFLGNLNGFLLDLHNSFGLALWFWGGFCSAFCHQLYYMI